MQAALPGHTLEMGRTAQTQLKPSVTDFEPGCLVGKDVYFLVVINKEVSPRILFFHGLYAGPKGPR